MMLNLESHKRVKYDAISQTHYFVPIAIETFGAFEDEAAAFLKDLGGRIAAVTPQYLMCWEHCHTVVGWMNCFILHELHEHERLHERMMVRWMCGMSLKNRISSVELNG